MSEMSESVQRYCARSNPNKFLHKQRDELLRESLESVQGSAKNEVYMLQWCLTHILRTGKRVDTWGNLSKVQSDNLSPVDTPKESVAIDIDDTEIQKHVAIMQSALSHLLQLRNQSEQHATVINDILCGIAKRTIDLIDQENAKKELARYTISASGYSFGQYNFDDIERDQQWLNSPRRNKYGLVMESLEQELNDIKLGRLSVEKYDSQRHGNPIDFFETHYGHFRKIRAIYRRDLWEIDNKLLTQIENCFYKPSKDNDKKDTRGYQSIHELLPSREAEIDKLQTIKATELDPKNMELNHVANNTLRTRKKVLKPA